MRVSAAVLERNGEPFVIQELDLDEPRPDEILVKMSNVGLCGTDIEHSRFFPTPAVLGHEGAGTVERTGALVTRVKPGDRVAMSYASCGECSVCIKGSPAYCQNFYMLNFSGGRLDGSSALSKDGERVNGHFLGQSSFATHAVVPESAVVKLESAGNLRIAGPFGCAFQTGSGAVFDSLKPEVGSTLAVFGTGAVGSAAIIAANLVSCSTVVAVDVNDVKLEAARRLGATHSINSSVESVAEVLAEVVPNGLDYAIDTTGREDVLRSAVEALGSLGTAGVVGVGPSQTMSFGWPSVLQGRTITGIIAGGSIPQVAIPRLLDLHATGKFPIDDMLAYYSFTQINEATEDIAKGKVGKAVLTF